MDTIGTWPAITGVAIECIVLGWLLLSEKRRRPSFIRSPRANKSILKTNSQGASSSPTHLILRNMPWKAYISARTNRV